MNVTLVVDTQVILHLIKDCLEKQGEEPYQGYLKNWQANPENKGQPKPSYRAYRRAITEANLVAVSSGTFLPDGMKAIDCIWVNDHKPYWRSEYMASEAVWSNIPRSARSRPSEKKRLRFLELRQQFPMVSLERLELLDSQGAELSKTDAEMLELSRQLSIVYKGGRKLPTNLMKTVREDFYALADRKGWKVLSKQGYEADDNAAGLKVVNEQLGEPRDLLLVTIDSDLTGLISDHLAWFCAVGYEPRVRYDLASLNYWATNVKKWVPFDEPRGIWDLKAAEGDRSDNLPPNTPLEVIDLLDPPWQFRIWECPDWHQKAYRYLVGDPVIEAPERGAKALQYLGSQGIPPVVKK